jgi:hypothetical protein
MGKQYTLREAALACGIALTLALQITRAGAFTTEPVAPPQTDAKPAPAPLTPFGQPLTLPGQTPQADLNDPLANVEKPSGTEIKIPGIGSVGTLPKLDFGLELLYGKGAPEGFQFDQHSLDQHSPEGDVQIKGVLSHKF